MKTQKIQIPASFDTAELRDIYANGYAVGFDCASWQDIPEIGTKLDRCVDYQGIGEIESTQDQADALQMLASEAEMNGRQYSPFEHFAHNLNEMEDSESAWEAYDDGVSNGILANIASRIVHES